MQCKVTREDASVLMQFLDKDGSGTVDMSEFLVGIRVIPTLSDIFKLIILFLGVS